MDNLEKNVKTIQSVHRALDILEFAVFSGNGQKLSTITEHCHLNKTTAFHLIKTLEARGYLEQSPDTLSYKTGGKVFELASKAYQNINLTSHTLSNWFPSLMKRSESITTQKSMVSLRFYVPATLNPLIQCVFLLLSENGFL
jgi:predicted transcriptional regulator